MYCLCVCVRCSDVLKERKRTFPEWDFCILYLYCIWETSTGNSRKPRKWLQRAYVKPNNRNFSMTYAGPAC